MTSIIEEHHKVYVYEQLVAELSGNLLIEQTEANFNE